MKKQALLFLLLGSLVATGCNNGNNNPSTSKGPDVEDLGVKEIHTDLMKQYLEDPDWKSIKTYVPKVNAEDSSYHNDQSQPNPIELTLDDVDEDAKHVVKIAKNVEFNDDKLEKDDKQSYK